MDRTTGLTDEHIYCKWIRNHMNVAFVQKLKVIQIVFSITRPGRKTSSNTTSRN